MGLNFMDAYTHAHYILYNQAYFHGNFMIHALLFSQCNEWLSLSEDFVNIGINIEASCPIKLLNYWKALPGYVATMTVVDSAVVYDILYPIQLWEIQQYLVVWLGRIHQLPLRQSFWAGCSWKPGDCCHHTSLLWETGSTASEHQSRVSVS